MRILTLILLSLTLGLNSIAQDSGPPVLGKIDELKNLRKVYVSAQSTDSRKLIVKQLGNKSGLEIVTDPKDAEFILEYVELSRQDKATMAGSSYHEKGEMRAYFTRPDGTKVISWSETETYYESSGMVTGQPNEVNLTKNFMRDLKKIRSGK